MLVIRMAIQSMLCDTVYELGTQLLNTRIRDEGVY